MSPEHSIKAARTIQSERQPEDWEKTVVNYVSSKALMPYVKGM